MQNLAAGAGDLERTLMDVKTCGTWVKVQLGPLLEEMMSPPQCLKNASVNPNSREVVEYALRLPGPDADNEVLLPVDAKFPQDDFERLMDAIDNAGREVVESARKALESRIRDEVKRISANYIMKFSNITAKRAGLPIPGGHGVAGSIRALGMLDICRRVGRIAPVYGFLTTGR